MKLKTRGTKYMKDPKQSIAGKMKQQWTRDCAHKGRGAGTDVKMEAKGTFKPRK
jgi:hypothetical protein